MRFGRCLLLVATTLALRGEIRAAEAGAAPVWGIDGTSPVPAAGFFETSADAANGLSTPFLQPEKKTGRPADRLHWRNVPKHAWLLLGGCFGLLGLYGFFRLRPPREIPFKSAAIIGGER